MQNVIVNNRKTQQPGEVQSNFQRSITFYDEAPQETIGIHEFHNIALSRLQVLKKIQFLYDSNKDKEGPEVIAEEINKYSRQHRLNVEGLYVKDKKGFEQDSSIALATKKTAPALKETPSLPQPSVAAKSSACTQSERSLMESGQSQKMQTRQKRGRFGKNGMAAEQPQSKCAP